ncbi:MAG: endo alpha-1,4 polygalactosaminidase [Planctomycetota bacterium]|jgi:cysteinyl-tRNA synthetase
MKVEAKKLLFTIILAAVLVPAAGCGHQDDIYREYMRDFVRGISSYSKNAVPGFIVIPQNGHELLTDDGEETGQPAAEYMSAIDGIGREDLFYGYNNDDVATPASERDYMIAFLDIAEADGIEVLVTDYCTTVSFVDDSYTQSALKNYISFAAERELDGIPDYPAYPAPPFDNTGSDVNSLADAKNFLYLINPGNYASKTLLLDAIKETDYDIVIIDLFDNDNIELNAFDVTSLKVKDNGGNRLVIAYMSIGEAEDYRYYWKTSWETSPPSWLARENPDWAGNYKVRYWDESWQSIIYGNESSYLAKILNAGFDGVYLDIIDAYEYFE